MTYEDVHINIREQKDDEYKELVDKEEVWRLVFPYKIFFLHYLFYIFTSIIHKKFYIAYITDIKNGDTNILHRLR